MKRPALVGAQGSVAIQIAIMLVGILGFVSLGVEVGLLLLKHREMQSAADSAAVSGATARTRGYPSDYTLEARAIAASGGFTNGVSGASVVVTSPPLAGSYTGVTGAVQVAISQPQPVYLMKLFGKSSVNVGARATAVIGSGAGCALQLIASASPGVSIDNGASVDVSTCGLGVNANGSAALTMAGGGKLNAQLASVVGQASISNGASITPSAALKISQAPMVDPYAGVALPTYSGCSNGTGKSYGYAASQQVLNPGVWCNGVSFGNAANIKMNPGVYVVDRGNFNVGGGITMTGTGVTIVLTSSTGSSYATSTIGNGATVSLSAPTSGALSGLLFYGDRRAPASNSSDLEGGVAVTFVGALYYPSQKLIFSNGSSNPAGCTQIIAGTIQFKGGSRLQANCSGTGVSGIGAGASKLVE